MSDPLGRAAAHPRHPAPRQCRARRERCELCGEPISPRARPPGRPRGPNLLCACRGCYLLFTSEGAGGGHFRAVPDRYLAFPDFELSPGQWDSLQIPVSVAFFFLNSSLGRVAAFYPGPAGATESVLPSTPGTRWSPPTRRWQSMEPDVEAFLVRAQPDRAGAECFLVPIDACYELVGHLRRLWRGFDGGREAHDAIDAFFDQVRAQAR